MVCIFCSNTFDDKTVPAEHIIPNNIGGTVVTYEVCEQCNKFFSKIDAPLHRQGHIFESYKSVDKNFGLELEFRFSKCFASYPGGGEIKFIPKSTSGEVITSKIRPGLLVYDSGNLKGNKTDSKNENIYLSLVRDIQCKYKISGQFIESHLKRYYDFIRNATVGSTFRDGFLTNKIEIKYEESHLKKTSAMPTETPHRFLAKACVEYAHLLGIASEISNLDLLKGHAKDGDFGSGKLNFFENKFTTCEGGVPFHFIKFTEKQFNIVFFGKYGVAVEITWKNHPHCKYLANDLIGMQLLNCNFLNDEIEITNEIMQIVKHEIIKRPSNIRRKI